MHGNAAPTRRNKNVANTGDAVLRSTREFRPKTRAPIAMDRSCSDNYVSKLGITNIFVDRDVWARHGVPAVIRHGSVPRRGP